MNSGRILPTVDAQTQLTTFPGEGRMKPENSPLGPIKLMRDSTNT